MPSIKAGAGGKGRGEGWGECVVSATVDAVDKHLQLRYNVRIDEKDAQSRLAELCNAHAGGLVADVLQEIQKGFLFKKVGLDARFLQLSVEAVSGGDCTKENEDFAGLCSHLRQVASTGGLDRVIVVVKMGKKGQTHHAVTAFTSYEDDAGAHHARAENSWGNDQGQDMVVDAKNYVCHFAVHFPIVAVLNAQKKAMPSWMPRETPIFSSPNASQCLVQIEEAERRSDVDAVLAAMRRHEGSEGVAEAACGALRSLAGNEDNRIKIAEEGGIGALLSAMRRHEGSEGVAKAACGALRNLAVNYDIQVKIAEEGGIGALLSAMRRHEGSEGMVEAACRALSFLALFDDNNMVKIAEEGGIVAVLSAMRRHEGSEGVAKAACGALGSFAVNDDIQVKIAEEGGIGALVSAMRRHEGSEGVAEAACHVLGYLAANADNNVKIAEEGGIGALLSAMRRHEGSEDVAEAACIALGNLASNADNKVKIAEEGGIGAVLAALNSHEGSEFVVEAACSVFLDVLDHTASVAKRLLDRHQSSENVQRLGKRLLERCESGDNDGKSAKKARLS